MDSTNTIYASFPFDWTVKSTTCQINYRKAFDIDDIDEVFCTIIKEKENKTELTELAILLGFNLQDVAEMDILNTYLKGLTEYNLIEVDKDYILLTEYGEAALQSKLKYKYYSTITEVLENQTASGENNIFSFKNTFDLDNKITPGIKIEKTTFEDFELQQKLQFQLFENNIYNGEIVELIENTPYISYKNYSLNCEITKLSNSFQIFIFKSGVYKPELVNLIELPENTVLKKELIRKGKYHHILINNVLITAKDVATYIDLWDWKELAENPKVDWSDKSIFEIFRTNGNGSIWSIISEKALIENIKPVIKDYEEYWNWITLTKRFDNNFIQEHIGNLNWDFEELSYKDINLVTTLLSNKSLVYCDWDWNYLSKNLPDDFIEKYIDDFTWDYFVITEVKSTILRNLLSKGNKSNKGYTEVLLSKSWNWKFISNKFDIKFLYNQISSLANRVDWDSVLNRFFNDQEIIEMCLKDESFKKLLKEYLPENYIVSHQNYLWTKELIEFFDNQSLIQWETTSYINGLDTNENVKWDKEIFTQYYKNITSEQGFFNISKHISEYSFIEDFPNFSWNWEGISNNNNLINNITFIENAYQGNFSYSYNLLWNEILFNSNFDINFWNKHIDKFYNLTDSEKYIEFWKILTQKEDIKYVLDNYQLPWDWEYITEHCSTDNILESFENENLLEKWNWKIATRRLEKEDVLNNIEDLTNYVDWEYLIKVVFSITNELSIENELTRIATCLSVLEISKRKEIWKILTDIYPFEVLYNYIKVTHKLEVFDWDWDSISNNKHFPTDINTLNIYIHNINWTILSENDAIKKKFNPDDWNNGNDWFNNLEHYLQKFADKWDWRVLSKNRNINYNRNLLKKFRNENWNWEYLSEFGGFLTKQKKDSDNYLEQIVKQFPKIRFEFLSNRKDIKIDSEFILSTKDKEWDWVVLSENERINISKELLLELKDKNWNWKAISKHKNLIFDNEMLLRLLNKDWDWDYLSDNSNIEFNIEFIEHTKTKQWNWKAVSSHKSFFPTFETLMIIKDFDIDWHFISNNKNLNPTKKILSKFENKWDWRGITRNTQINFNDIDLIERFVDKWDWTFICESSNLELNSNILLKFKKYLKWDLISANTNIDFTKEIIQTFKPFWNWSLLKKNKRIEELLDNYIIEVIDKSPVLSFIDKIEQQWSQWKGNIYHFTHIDNAVEIIKNRKIQSRNKANIKGDAAGNVVHRRDDAHDYARFYFRPNTPTQFYNEFLGKNTSDGYRNNHNEWVSWYEKARGLGYPKCPIPIFFRFSLKEVLFNCETKCCISNGNMQTSSTRFGSIDKMIDKFGFEDLYYTPEQYATKEDYNRYRNFAQQEFLIKDEFLFNDIEHFEIVCPSEADKKLLINLLGDEHKDILQKIVLDSNYYNLENPRIRIEEEKSELHISTTFKGNGYFVLNTTNDAKIIEILSGDVSKIENNKIIFKSYVSIGKLDQKISLSFIDESNRNWFIYTT
jgi:hypothetical protein